MYYTLAIDSGNTRIKWGIFADHFLMNNNCASTSLADSLESVLEKFPDLNAIIISHVAGARIKEELAMAIANKSSSVYWLQAQANQCGVHNGYVIPWQLGSDRWAGIIAAWNLYHEPCLVINAGTAVTVDAVSYSGDHLGGIILPSIHSLSKCLSLNTQLQASLDGAFSIFPTNTQDAMYSGNIQALVGAIDRMYSSLISRLDNSKDVKCIISGGGAHIITPFIKYPYEYIDCLVINGLFLIAEEIRSKNSN